jgi:hypothetical protein
MRKIVAILFLFIFLFQNKTFAQFYKQLDSLCIMCDRRSPNLLWKQEAFPKFDIQSLKGKGLKIGMIATESGWSATLGTVPDDGSPAFFLDTSE